MSVLWAVIGVALLAVYLYLIYSRGGERTRGQVQPQRAPERDLSANINPSQLGNETDLWPDRTGARTRRELGARQAADVTYRGDREEHKGEQARESLSAGIGRPPAVPATTDAPASPAPSPGGGRVTDGNHPPTPVSVGVRREVKPGAPESKAEVRAADGGNLAPEDEFGEDRPALRSTAPDQPPTQWHPEEHGVPGDHLRDGHHTSATGPERITNTSDPFAHAPVPGPNHVPPPGGQELPPGTQP